MKVKDIPDLRTTNYPERITIAVSAETRKKLEQIQLAKNKKPAVLARELIEEFLELNKEFFETAG